MDRQKADLDELVFVIETCQNCRDHGWNTRHDEQKYLDFFNKRKCIHMTLFMFVFSVRSHHREITKRRHYEKLDPQVILAL